MDKIVELLKQLKASPELTENIISSIQGYKEHIDSEAKAELNRRLEIAKQVCVEELAQEKQELARKVEVFLEARIATINREAQKSAAIGESESCQTLKELKALLEGVSLGGTPEDGQAAMSENKKLRLMVAKLQEEKAQAVQAAQRSNTICAKALASRKVAEERLAGKAPLAESKTTPGTTPAKPGTRLETARTQATTPTTTRQTLVESQTKPVASKQAPQSQDIASIAAGLDGSPAF